MATKLGGIYIDVRAPVRKLDSDFNKIHAKLKRVGDRMQRTMKRVLAISAVGVIALSRSVLTLGVDFESTMKTVQAWSGASGMELQRLTDIAREMGATTEHSANQSAEALKFLAAAGFTVNQSIAALPKTLDLATAGQVDLASASDITTDVLTAFGLEVEELDRINNAFITTSSSTNTNVLMLGESFKMVAPTAKLMGLNVEQTAAFLGTLASSGVKATMAGSGLNMVLLKTTKAAKALGMDAMTPLVDVLKEMKRQQWDAIKIGEVFGARQVKTAGILMDNIDTYEMLTQKIIANKTATSDLAAIIRDSLGNALKILQSTIQSKMLDVFDTYKGKIREIVEGMTNWLQQNEDLIQQGVEKTIDAIADASTKAWEVLKKSKEIYDSLPKEALKLGLYGLAFLGTFGTAGIVAAAILAINRAATALNITLESSAKLTNKIWSGLAAWANATGWIWLQLSKGLASIMDPFGEKWVVKGFGDEVKRVADEMNRAGDMTKMLASETGKLKDEIVEWVSITPRVKDLWEEIDILARTMNNFRGRGRPWADDAMGDIKKLTDLWKNFGFVAVGSMVSVKDALKEASGSVNTLAEDIQNELVYAFEQVYRIITDSISGALFAAIKGDIDGLKDVWKSFLDSMLKTFTDMLAEMAVIWLRSKIFSFLGSLLGGGGGLGSLFGAGSSALLGILGASLSVIIPAVVGGFVVYGIGKILGLWGSKNKGVGTAPRPLQGTLSPEVADMLRNYEEIARGPGGFGSREAFDRNIDINFLLKLAKSETTTFFEKMTALNLVSTVNGWESTATINFITALALNEALPVKEKLAALGFVIGKTGWESEATLTFIAQLEASGMGWAEMFNFLKSAGATDDYIKRIRLQFLEGNTVTSWEKLKEALLSQNVNVPDLMKKIKLELEFLNQGEMTWAQFEKFLRNEGLSETIIRKLELRWIGDEKMGWKEIKSFLGGKIPEPLMRDIFLKYKQSGNSLTWKQIEELLVLKGTSKAIIRKLKLEYLKSAGGLSFKNMKDLLKGVGLSKEMILKIKAKFEGHKGQMTWAQLVKMLESLGIDQSIINEILGKLDPSDPLKKLAKEGLKPSKDLDEFLKKGLEPSSTLKKIWKQGIPVNYGGGGGPQGRAHGGPVSPFNSFMIGEEGPELFTPPRPGNITPNNELGGGGGDIIENHIHIHIGDEELPKVIDRVVVERNNRNIPPTEPAFI